MKMTFRNKSESGLTLKKINTPIIIVKDTYFTRPILLLLIGFLFPFILSAQQPDTLIKKLDSARSKTDTAGQKNIIKQEAYNATTSINARTYFVLLASNTKQQFSKPFHMQPKDWKRFGIGVAVIAPFFFADEPVQKYVVDLTDNNPSMGKVSKFITNMGGPYEAVTLSLMAGYGIIFKKEKIKTTALLASQSYLISGAIQTVVKILTGRQRPFVYNPDQVEAEPKFHGPFHPPFKDANGKTITSSFPSGHTTGAFAAATVFAMEYRDRPAVKIIAYGSASLIGLSRITENKHWTTDVLVGTALGILSGRQVVNNYHRYAEIKNAEKKKGIVSFNISYQSGVILPQIIYTFR